MKLTIILIIATIMQVSAEGFAQELTLNQNRASVKQIFREIKKQTGYDVFYLPEMINERKTIAANFLNAPLEEVMKKCLAGESLVFTIFENSIVVKKKEKTVLDRVVDYFANIDVYGKIVDEKGQPLAGATILIKGSALGTTTNADGQFTLTNVDEKAILVISYLGYKNRELKAASNLGTISLEVGTANLEAVNIVSTGYQSLPRERATGSFEKIDNALLNRTTGTDVFSRLEGTVPGIYFHKTTADPVGLNSLTIRGVSSLKTRNPLIVLDNMAYDGDPGNINPNDIENVTVLKDAAAASIWGSRAGNGVLVITTKKGAYEKPMQISLNTNYTFAEKPDLFYTPQISSAEFVEVEKFLYGKQFYDDALNNLSPFPRFVTPVVELLDKKNKLPIGDAQGRAQIDAQIEGYKQYDVRNDYEKYVYRGQFNQQHALNISGGNKHSNYFISGGFDRNLNAKKANGFDRMTLRSNYDMKIVKPLELKLGFIFTQSKNNQPGTTVGYREGNLTSIYPYARLADDNGNPLEPGSTFARTYLETLNSGANPLDWHYRPLEDMYKGTIATKSQDMLFNLGTVYNFLPGFSVDVKYQYQTGNSGTERSYAPDSWQARDIINSFTNPSTRIGVVPAGGLYNSSTGKSSNQSLRGQLNVDKSWGKHQLYAIAGAEVRKSYGEFNSTGNLYGYSFDTKTFQVVDYRNQYPRFHGGTSTIPYNGGVGDSDNRHTALYTNASYTYGNRYTISASARKDASNVYGSATNRRGSPLWSAGGAWNISNEDFYKVELLPSLKLRGTYGFSGNTVNGIPAFSVVTRNVDLTTLLTYARSLNLPNPNLRWEKVGMLNVGLDFGFKNNRVNGSIEYFRKRSTDVVALAPVDPTTGYLSQNYNAASLKGRGLELSLNTINLGPGDFQWNSNLNVSYNRNTVVDYYVELDYSTNFVGTGGINPLAGKDVYGVFAYPSAGLDPQTGDPRGYFNGQVSNIYSDIVGGKVSDLQYFGSSAPLFFGGLRNSFSYHGFTLSANVLFKFKYFFKRQGLSYTSLFYGNTGHAEFADRWKQPGDEKFTNVPSMTYPANSYRDLFYTNSSDLIERGDHIRLQDIVASYTINKLWAFKNFRVYGNMANLGVIWRKNKKDIDPDYIYGYRAPRTFSLGLSTNF